MIFGYARVSTIDQNLDRQIDQLLAYGVKKENIYTEKETGMKANRPVLNRLLDKLREDDIVVVESFSRLGRSTKNLIEIVDFFKSNNIQLVSLKESFDTTSAHGKLMLTVFQAFAEFERNLIAERTRDGLVSARARGRVGGRPRVQDKSIQKAIRMYEAKTFTIPEITETCRIGKTTLYRYVKGYKR